MKKVKIMAVILFMATFIIGGTNLVSAYTTTATITGLNASFFSGVNYSAAYEKFGWGPQEVQVYKTTGDRKVQISGFAENGESISGYVWREIKTGQVADWSSSPYQMPSSVMGQKYKIGVKLLLPWFDTKIENALWVLDF